MDWNIQHTYIQARNSVVAYNTCTTLCYSQSYNHNLKAQSQAVALPPFEPREYPTQPQVLHLFSATQTHTNLFRKVRKWSYMYVY